MTPFKEPSESSFPDINDGVYLIRCINIEDADPGDFGARMKWVFNLWNMTTQEPIIWDTGDTYEWWQYTSESLGARSNARKYFQAFVNRELQSTDSPQALLVETIGRYAQATIANSDDGWPKIANIRAHVTTGGTSPDAPQPVAPVAPAPAAPVAPVATPPAPAPPAAPVQAEIPVAAPPPPAAPAPAAEAPAADPAMPFPATDDPPPF